MPIVIILILIMILGYLYWDPNPALFSWNIPFLGRPILWYGFLFAVGFFFSYRLFFTLLKTHPKESVRLEARKITDYLAFYCLMGLLIGARVFEVFFYGDWRYYFNHPLNFFKVWEGGLASHGAVIGIICSLIIYYFRYPKFFDLHVFDNICIASGIAGAFIRLGNFFNQEILGKPTALPWGIIFGHPVDYSYPIPRHPVQLYEAGFYLLFFLFLWYLKRRLANWEEGKIGGLFLTIMFFFRFGIEFLKEEQSLWLHDSFLTMGQYLSIPLIGLGLFLLFRDKFQNVSFQERK